VGDATPLPTSRQGSSDARRRRHLYCPVAHLDQHAYERARAFLDQGRALERAVLAFHFEDGPAWQVVDALATFQNPDGGFGHGLEPDLLAGASSAVATASALRRLAEVGAAPTNAVVDAAVAWSRRTIDPHARTWRIVPPEVDAAPHAPWWDQDGLEERFAGFVLNPKADLTAQLYALAASEDGWLDRLSEDVAREVDNRVASGLPLEMHELLGVVALVDAPHLPVPVRRHLYELLLPLVETSVGRDADAWGSYGVRPLAVAPRPGCAFAGHLSELIEAELAYLVAEQAADGAWWPTWSWDRDESIWEQQRIVWAGILTLDAVTRLDAYGRLSR
jgi:hypothetical protein